MLQDTKSTPNEQTVLNIPKGLDLNKKATPHDEILQALLQQIQRIDFREELALEQDEKPTRTQFRIKVIEKVLKIAIDNNWNICKRHDFIYLYNGGYWSPIENDEFQGFLGEAAECMGVKWECSKDYKFRKELLEQFLAVANLPAPIQNKTETLINFLNGTLVITAQKQELREPDSKDFLTYQLPFEYNPKAVAPLFNTYLETVQPDIDRQHILAEYLGYTFISTSVLKLEKCLLLYGTGANGKSVFFEIVNDLLGPENVSSYSLQSLTNENGYTRAKIGNKLVNYASEISGKMEQDIFKRMASGEPVEARLPYGEPFLITNYAKMIFNVNELPKDVEHTSAYFRRFIIIPFEVTIPEAHQDRELATKIIQSELPGVFNWVMQGLSRLLIQKKFTESEAVKKQIKDYERQSDTIRLFIDEEGYVKGLETDRKAMKDLYAEYKVFCSDNGNYACSMMKFSERLKNQGYYIHRTNSGNVIHIRKSEANLNTFLLQQAV